MKDNNLIMFSRILRWSLGTMFISAGIYYVKDGGWPAIFFGTVMLATGFFRPRRCIGDACEVSDSSSLGKH